jgi:hypothetical protein
MMLLYLRPLQARALQTPGAGVRSAIHAPMRCAWFNDGNAVTRRMEQRRRCGETVT